MTHQMLLIGAMCSATLMLTSCGDQNNPVKSLPTIEIDQFPMTVGSRWLYSAEDTVRGLIDTVEVEIARAVDINSGQPSTLWRFNSRQNQIGRADVYVTVVADTVYFQDERTRETYLKLAFPIVGGATWFDEQAVGTYASVVEGEAPIKVPAGKFQSLKVRTDVNTLALDLILGSRFWVAPGVGFVKIEYILGFRFVLEQYHVWELLSYTPAN